LSKNRGELKENRQFQKCLVASANDFGKQEKEVPVSKLSDFALSLFKKIELNKKVFVCFERR
jgi:hypothetical protein